MIFSANLTHFRPVVLFVPPEIIRKQKFFDVLKVMKNEYWSKIGLKGDSLVSFYIQKKPNSNLMIVNSKNQGVEWNEETI